MDFTVKVAEAADVVFASAICQEIEQSATARGTGIAKRSVKYVEEKISNGQAVLALTEARNFAGFCYIESWEHGRYVVNSGLIVAPHYRKYGLAEKIKKQAFELSRLKFPDAKMFGLTTSLAVMRINSRLGYVPVTYSELTTDQTFWDGCKSCVNFETLKSKNQENCLCTAMLYQDRRKK